MMMEMKKKFEAAIRAEFELMAARHALAMMFCDMAQPDEVAAQVTAQRAAQNRVIALERLRDYYSGRGM